MASMLSKSMSSSLLPTAIRFFDLLLSAVSPSATRILIFLLLPLLSEDFRPLLLERARLLERELRLFDRLDRRPLLLDRDRPLPCPSRSEVRPSRVVGVKDSICSTPVVGVNDSICCALFVVGVVGLIGSARVVGVVGSLGSLLSAPPPTDSSSCMGLLSWFGSSGLSGLSSKIRLAKTCKNSSGNKARVMDISVICDARGCVTRASTNFSIMRVRSLPS
mmetsp:Transcript_4283/g.11696  ORF Transcript_4283/g.11696 Transcript_4283/m.11696 type:complete len:220 (-) Transcript_4283:792-1451(-)